MDKVRIKEARQVARAGRRGKAAVVVLGLVGAVICGAAMAAQPFHAASTPAEHALDQIIKTADHDDDLLDNLLVRAPVPKTKQVDYGQLLTPALISELRREERQMVKDNCHGHYLKGKVCGFEFAPVTCAQDSGPVREYETLGQTDATATVLFRYKNFDAGANRYRLVRADGGWRIDDILCAGEKQSFRKLLSP